jgi:hypothetical protein
MPALVAVILLLAAFAAAHPGLAQLVPVQSPLGQQLWPPCEVTGRGDAGNTSPETLRMRLRQGIACPVVGRGPARQFVVTPPRNGALVIDGPRAIYRPNPGFAGTDVFVISAAPPGSPNPIYTTVNVEVR